jgi:DNA recombination protein RmuC
MVTVALIVGFALGACVVWLVGRGRTAGLASRVAELAAKESRLVEAERELASVEARRDAEQQAFEEKLALLEGAKAELTNVFKAQSAESLQQNAGTFLQLAEAQLVKPLRESLTKVDEHARALEQQRQKAYGAVAQQLETLAQGQEQLRKTAGNLVTALRTPHVRGRWGEVQLRRVVEAAGLLEHCDFVLQATTRDSEGALLRPDLVVRLPGSKHVVVDAKVPLGAYLDACECDDDAARAVQLAEHARQFRDHVLKLSSKAYWRQFDPSPDFVVMFLPDESFLRAALEHDSTIGEDAWRASVVPASPTNLFALLRTIAAIWQQETVAQSAREVHTLGQELFDRLSTMGGHFQQLGRSLTSAVGHYNRTIGALESRVLVTGRKLAEHGMSGDLPDLSAIEVQSRPLTAPELAESADTAPRALDAA